MSGKIAEPDWLVAKVDEILAEEAREKRGRPPAEWHAAAFAEMGVLIEAGKSLHEAANIVAQSLAQQHIVTVTVNSLRYMFQRHIREQLIDTAGKAVTDDDEAAFVAAYRALRERDKQDGNRTAQRQKK